MNLNAAFDYIRKNEKQSVDELMQFLRIPSISAHKEHDADVIIMGSRGRSDFAGAILGSTAHKVIHLADRPVLVIR